MKNNQTIKARAEEIGVDRRTLQNWRDAGCDIFNDDAVRKHVGTLRSTPPGIRLTFMPTSSPPPPGCEIQTLETLERRLLDCNDYNDARTLRAQVAGIKDVIRARVESGELIAKAKSDADAYAAGMAVRMALMTLSSTLPPHLAGMNEAAIQKALRAEFRRMLEAVADGTLDLWPSEQQAEEFKAWRARK